VKTEADLPSKVLNMPFVNPQNGPIRVEGARKGDVLAVRILDIEPRGPQPAGTTALITEFGGLVATGTPPCSTRRCPSGSRRWWSPARASCSRPRSPCPTSPSSARWASARDRGVSSLQPDYWGGNMDLPDVAPGAIVYFPVQHEGALSMSATATAGRATANLCGVAVEMAATATMQIDLIKGWTIPGVRLETEDFIMSVGSARPMEDAARIAYRDLIRWLVADLRLRGERGLFPLHPGGQGSGSATWSTRNTPGGGHR
jgi:amidase